MRVRDLMTREVETTSPVMPATLARDQMRRRRIHHLVVMRRGAPCGIVSERDLGGPRGLTLARGASVADLMTPLAVTIRSDATASQAANLMRGRGIGCLPVVDGSSLVGIVTTSDLLELVGRGRGVAIGPRPKRVMARRGPRGAARSVR